MAPPLRARARAGLRASSPLRPATPGWSRQHFGLRNFGAVSIYQSPALVPLGSTTQGSNVHSEERVWLLHGSEAFATAKKKQQCTLVTQLRATHTVVPGLVHYFILSKFTPSKPFIQAEQCLLQAVTYVLLLTQIICLCLFYLSVTHCKCQKTGTPSPHRRVGGAAPPPSRLRAPGSDLSLSASPAPRVLCRTRPMLSVTAFCCSSFLSLPTT